MSCSQNIVPACKYKDIGVHEYMSIPGIWQDMCHIGGGNMFQDSCSGVNSSPRYISRDWLTNIIKVSNAITHQMQQRGSDMPG